MRLDLLLLTMLLLLGLVSSYKKLNGKSFLRNFKVYSSIDNQDTVIGRCTSKIKSALNPTMIQVTATNDDPNGSHIQIVCVSSEFEGKNTLARQRMIYKAIWDEMSGPVHACDSIVAKTPQEMGQ